MGCSSLYSPISQTLITDTFRSRPKPSRGSIADPTALANQIAYPNAPSRQVWLACNHHHHGSGRICARLVSGIIHRFQTRYHPNAAQADRFVHCAGLRRVPKPGFKVPRHGLINRLCFPATGFIRSLLRRSCFSMRSLINDIHSMKQVRESKLMAALLVCRLCGVAEES